MSESKAYDMDIELDDEDGTLVYEVEFKSGNMEYDYEIDAAPARSSSTRRSWTTDTIIKD